MLIDSTYFFGDVPVPQVLTTAVAEKITASIQKREPEYLEAVLGYSTYKQLTEGLAAGSPAQKWIDIRDGAEYRDQTGILQKWRGLIRPGTPKRSAIAYYVYYWWLRSEVNKTTSTGQSKPETQNAKPVSSFLQQQSAWNEMAIMSRELYWFLYANQATYPDWNISEIQCDISKRKFFETIKGGI